MADAALEDEVKIVVKKAKQQFIVVQRKHKINGLQIGSVTGRNEVKFTNDKGIEISPRIDCDRDRSPHR